MLIPYENKKIFIASEPVDFRMSIDGLSSFIRQSVAGHLHDGSIYVFFNKQKNKIKCLFWDRNGFVLYYKRLEGCTFKLKKRLKTIENISAEELEILLSGFSPDEGQRVPHLLEHTA